MLWVKMVKLYELKKMARINKIKDWFLNVCK